MSSLPTAFAKLPNWENAYRIIPAQYPPVNLFEAYHDSPEDLQIALELEARTDPQAINKTGNLEMLPRREWIYGEGASWVMTAFTHTGNPSRFTAGKYGVYYAADTLHTALKETVFHRELFLQSTGEPNIVLTMRVLLNKVTKPMVNIFDREFASLLHPDSYSESQIFAADLRAKGHWGIHYPSVRDPEGECVAAFRTGALTLPAQWAYLDYHWCRDTGHITHAINKFTREDYPLHD